MDQTEIKELYAEELTLLKRIQRYGKEQKPDARDRIERVTLLLLYRIYSEGSGGQELLYTLLAQYIPSKIVIHA